MPVFDDLVAANLSYVASGAHHPLPVRPARQLAIVTCMDSRIDTFDLLGLRLGDAHVIRTGGARITDDVLRSLTLSTAILGTRTVALIGHTDCGLLDPDDTLCDRLTTELGHPPLDRDWGAFAKVDDPVKADCDLLRRWSDAPSGFLVAGYVLDVKDGLLREVSAPAGVVTSA